MAATARAHIPTASAVSDVRPDLLILGVTFPNLEFLLSTIKLRFHSHSPLLTLSANRSLTTSRASDPRLRHKHPLTTNRDRWRWCLQATLPSGLDQHSYTWLKQAFAQLQVERHHRSLLPDAYSSLPTTPITPRWFVAGCSRSHHLLQATCATTVRSAVRLTDRKSTRLNSSHSGESRMPSSA